MLHRTRHGAALRPYRAKLAAHVFGQVAGTAGIDFALTLAAEIAGTEFAQGLQLSLEYAPAPPFDAGRPETAPPEVLARVTSAMAQAFEARRAGVDRVAATVI